MPTLETTRKDQVTVEAETVEDALAEISATLGEDAEIMRAQKVHRGGVGGFFAKEMVQLTARRRRKSVPLRQAPAAAQDKPSGGGIADVLERMAQDADAEDGDFRTALRRELAAQPADLNSDAFLDAVGWESAEPENESEAAEVVTAAVAADEVPDHGAEAADDHELPAPVAVGPVIQVAAEVAEPRQEITDLL